MSDIDGMEHVIRNSPLDGVFTRRQYMARKLLLSGKVSLWAAIEAVSSTAIGHPEWDMDEQHTWDEWEVLLAQGRERGASD